MKIVRIFDDHLFAFKIGKVNEYHVLFEKWNNPVYLEDFFEKNKNDLANERWGNISIEEAIEKTINEAQNLEHKLVMLSKRNEKVPGLETMFQPLSDSETKIVKFSKSKARHNWLRIYALKVEKGIYIVTGGAIKLTQTMQERVHTMKELEKIERCRNFLISQNLFDMDGIIETYEI